MPHGPTSLRNTDYVLPHSSSAPNLQLTTVKHTEKPCGSHFLPSNVTFLQFNSFITETKYCTRIYSLTESAAKVLCT